MNDIDSMQEYCHLPSIHQTENPDTPSNLPDARVRLLHVSDLHFGTEQAPVVRALVGWAARHRPTGLVITGDITQRATAAQFAGARQLVDDLKALGVPLLACVPGNHDIPLFALWERLLCPYRRYARAFGRQLFDGDGVWVNEDDALLLIAVNTTRRWRHVRGELSRAQIQRVAQRLHTSRPGQLRAVLVHQPLAVPPAADGRPGPDADQVLRRADEAIATWTEAGCDLVLGGHIHLPYVLPAVPGVARGMWVVQAGTATSHRTRPGAPNAFVELLWPGPAATGRHCEWRQWDFDAASSAFVLARQGVVALAPR